VSTFTEFVRQSLCSGSETQTGMLLQPSLTLDLINPQVAGQPTRKHLLSIIHRTPIPLLLPSRLEILP